MSESDRRGSSEPSRIGVYIIATFAVCAVALSLNAYRHANQREKAAHIDTEHAFTLCRTGDEGVVDMACVPNALQAKQDQQYADADLKAQQEMADWALLMMIVTGAGVVFIAQTLDATREAVDVTREIGEGQIRAYLTAKGGQVTVFQDKPEFTFTISFFNTGNSPAREIDFYPQIILQRHDLLDDQPIRTKLKRLRINEIAARETRGRDGIVFFRAPYEHYGALFRDGNVSVKIGGNLRFVDAFDKVRRTKVAVAGFIAGEPDKHGFKSGRLKPCDDDLWSKRFLGGLEKGRS